MKTIPIIYPDGTIETCDINTNTCSNKTIQNTNSISNSEQHIAYIIKDTTQIQTKDIYMIAIIDELTSKKAERYKHTIFPTIVTPKNHTSAMWETSVTQTQKDVIFICDQNGSKKKAIFIHTAQQEFTGMNALVPVEKGDYIIRTQYAHQQYSTSIYQIISTNTTEKTAKSILIEYVSDNIHSSKISYERCYLLYPYLRSVIKSSKRKAKKGKTFDIHFAEYKHLLNK